jgi:hypothetical protein
MRESRPLASRERQPCREMESPFRWVESRATRLHQSTMSALARMRHSKIADGLPLSGEERSCSEHHRMAEFGPTAVIGRIEIPRRNARAY